MPVQGEEQRFTICVGADCVPLEMNSTHVAGGATARTPRVGTKECEDLGVVTLDVYSIHSPSEPCTVDNRNASDALGDMASTCAQGGAASSPGGPAAA